VLIHARKVLTHSFIYAASNAMAVASGLVLIPFYTRHLSIEEFGAFSLVTTFGMFLMYVLDLGLPTGFVRRYYTYNSDDRMQRMRLASTVFWILLATSVVFASVSYASADYISQMLLAAFSGTYLVQLMTVAVFVTTLSGVSQSLLRVLEQPGRYFGLAALKGIGVLIMVPTLLVVYGRGVEGIFEGQLVIAIIVAIGGWLLTARYYGFTFSAVDGRAVVTMGLLFWPAMILNWVIDFSDMYFVRYFFDLEQVAIYAIAYKVAQIVFYSVLAFSIGWAPILFGILRDSNPQDTLAKLFRMYTITLISFAYVLALLTPELISVLGPPAYAAAKDVSPILCVAYVVYGLFIFFLSGVVVTGKFQYQSLALIVGAASNAVLNFVLIPIYGLIGAACATLAAYSVTAYAGFRFAQRLYPIPYQWRDLFSVGCAAAMGYILYVLVLQFGMNEIVAKFGALLAYLALLFSIGGVTMEEIRTVKSIWNASENSA
jgi:O-antigen/teichoic acid export membrane protein